MSSTYQTILFIHIAAGTLSLLAGTGVIALHKGTPLHKTLGKIFVFAMLVAGISSLYMSIAKHLVFLFSIGLFSTYLTLSGLRALFLSGGTKFSTIDTLLNLYGITSSLVLAVLGINLFSEGFFFGLVPTVFGMVNATLTTLAAHAQWRKPISNQRWLRHHAFRMAGAYTASVTAFVVVNLSIEQQWILWLFPTALIIPLVRSQYARFVKAD
ncbi:MAG TPA: hypothetical protein PKD90_03300 [Phnomibacter sp.]|nr:hypothetical protein [Phnomibacter sp.]